MNLWHLLLKSFEMLKSCAKILEKPLTKKKAVEICNDLHDKVMKYVTLWSFKVKL